MTVQVTTLYKGVKFLVEAVWFQGEWNTCGIWINDEEGQRVYGWNKIPCWKHGFMSWTSLSDADFEAIDTLSLPGFYEAQAEQAWDGP